MFKKILEAITGDDNVTIEPAYLWAAVVITVGLGLEIYSVISGKAFDFQAYGVAAIALLSGLGISAKLGK